MLFTDMLLYAKPVRHRKTGETCFIVYVLPLALHLRPAPRLQATVKPPHPGSCDVTHSRETWWCADDLSLGCCRYKQVHRSLISAADVTNQKSGKSSVKGKAESNLMELVMYGHEHTIKLTLKAPTSTDKQRWMDVLNPAKEETYSEWDCPQARVLKDYDAQQVGWRGPFVAAFVRCAFEAVVERGHVGCPLGLGRLLTPMLPPCSAAPCPAG